MDYVIELITGGPDSLIWIVAGAVIALLAGILTNRGGAIGNIIVGLIGGIIGGVAFDWLDFMNVGDYADPIIAGAVGGVILWAIISLFRRE